MASFRYYTDGAATMIRKNGKYLREAGGWAFVLLIDNREDSVCSGGCPLTTNNEMELYAIYASMKDFLLKSESGDMVEICSDSSYCIDIFTKWAFNWQKKGWKKSDGKPVLNVDLWKRLLAAAEPHEITWHWVKGHAGHPENERCDRLATAAADALK